MMLIVYLKKLPLTKSSYLKINGVKYRNIIKGKYFNGYKTEKNITSQILIFQSDPSNSAQDAAHYVGCRKNTVQNWFALKNFID